MFDPSVCTGCMECALACPDGAIPNTVFTIDTPAGDCHRTDR
nr:4Fe-4S binding protein [Mobiluncus holmesii]